MQQEIKHDVDKLTIPHLKKLKTCQEQKVLHFKDLTARITEIEVTMYYLLSM